MADLRTEDEQLKALNEWWQANGKSLLIGVAIAAAAVLGWNGWQDKRAADAESASILYQNMMEAVVGAIGAQQDQAQLATAGHLAQQLKGEHESSAYARFAGLMMARIAADAAQYDQALAELDWVLAHEPSASMRAVATMRKARVLAAKGDVDQALGLLSTSPAGFEASAQELKGDLWLLKGDRSEARKAYEAARAAIKGGAARPLLDIKLNDLAAEEG